MRSVADGITNTYEKQLSAAENSGFAYTSQAQKNRDLQWIQGEINRARQISDFTPSHAASLKALERMHEGIKNTPVDPAGGSGNWRGTPQQRAQEALKMQKQFVEDYKQMLQQFDRIRQQTRRQIAKDNAKYANARKQGVQSMQNTGLAGLAALDALDASENRARNQQLEDMDRLTKQSILKAYQLELMEQLGALGKDWDDLMSMAGNVPGMNDPEILKMLEDIKNFVPLNPDDFGGGNSETLPREGGITTEYGIFIPTDEGGNMIHPANAPWGTYSMDKDCGNGVITGIGRDAAIAEWERLNSEYPEDPRYAPAFHFPGDTLAMPSGKVTGAARERAIAEFDKKVAAEKAAQQAAQSTPTPPTGSNSVVTSPPVPPPAQYDPPPSQGSLLPPKKKNNWTWPKNEPQEPPEFPEPSWGEELAGAVSDGAEAVWERTKNGMSNLADKAYDNLLSEEVKAWWEREKKNLQRLGILDP